VTAFFLVAAAMLVVALVLILVPLLRRRSRTTDADTTLAPATISSVVAAIAMPIAAAGLYLGITTYPWRAAPPQGVSVPATEQESIKDAIAKIEARLASQPDDATGWRMLGRSLVVTGEFARAVTAYERAIALTGGLDPGLRLDLAEALVLANDPAAQTRARQIADEVLVNDPANQKALWYGGVIALRANDPATARQRFTALLAQEPPGEIRGILEAQLAALGPAEPGATTGAAETRPAAGATAGPRGRTIRVRVTVARDLAARVKPGVPVFVSARQPGIPGPPLAALRLTSEALPATLELSDANAMIEGRNLSSVDDVEVTARIAFGGTAVTTPGDLFGSRLSRRGDAGQLEIVIEKQAP
jgi:cytochrome c-type biogenesis protein CcmH